MSELNYTLFSLLKDLVLAFFLSFGLDLSVLIVKLENIFDILFYVCLFIAILLFIGVLYLSIKIGRLRRWEHEQVYGAKNLISEIRDNLEITPPVKNQDWEKIINLLNSDNPNDWKSAIMEADKILEMVVSHFVVPGDNLGEKLKNIEKSDFLTLEEAWQAHKVRNRIAHEPNFHLSRRDAQATIDNFRRVFDEFDFI